MRLNSPLLSQEEQEEHVEQDEQDEQGDEQLVQAPHPPWQELSQHSFLRNLARQRSHHDSFSQQLSQLEVQHGVGQQVTGLQQGVEQQGVGQQEV